MEKQEIRTFGRRHGKKLSARKESLVRDTLPTLCPRAGEKIDILEIGFGSGEHVRDLAIANPGRVILGAEPFMNGVAALLSAICDESGAVLDEYKNIRIFPDDVRIVLNTGEYGFDEIWILHPDPWPKARHEKRRLLNSDFLNLLSKNLGTRGKIIIGTDHWEYYDWILEQVKNTNLCETDLPHDIIKTRYQKKNMAKTAEPKYIILTRP